MNQSRGKTIINMTAAINEMMATHPNGITSDQASIIGANHKTNRAMLFFMRQTGFATKNIDGTFKINSSNIGAVVGAILKETASYNARKSAERRAKKNAKTQIKDWEQPINKELEAIKLLKSLGYKLMKPIPPVVQFEEI